MQGPQEMQVWSLGREDSLQEEMAIHSRESHGQRSLAGYSPRACKELDTAELHAHTRELYRHGRRDL